MNETEREPTTRKDLLKAALRRIEELEARLAARGGTSDAAAEDHAGDQAHARAPLAVIGMACRFPGDADTPERLWDLLREGRDGTTEVPRDRWDVDPYYDPTPGALGKLISRRGGFIRGVDEFDPHLFGISPREAGRLDPAQRLLLEAAWEALERAGIAPDSLAGSATSVYVGVSNYDYALLRALPGAAAMDTYFGAGTAHSMASGRISYVLGLRGPSISIDTACSSSLMAVHLAAQSLRSGESRMALAGGANVVLSPMGTIAASHARMLSPEGRCKTFDASADGYVRSEGCGMVVLKRLADAQADGDPILAVIRGSAANQDGRSNGVTAPNGRAQEAVLRAALADAGITAADVSYVEAHGTGTALGDPIEVQALVSVFRDGHSPANPLRLGALKSNIGHQESAAGVAGLIKLVLALQHGELPASLHVHTLNPLINWDDAPVRVVTRHEAWPGPRRIAGISSFGFSGTNVHLILEEAPAQASGQPARDENSERPRHVLPLSAAGRPALAQMAGQYASHLREHLDDSRTALGDLCHSAAVSRAALPHRLAVDGATREEIASQLARFADGNAEGLHVGEVGGGSPKVAFLFTGQGSQYVGMGATLYAAQPVFRDALDRCAELFKGHVGRSLIDVVFTADAGGDRLLDATAWTQPSLFAIEYALAALWRSWGVEPTAVVGHSIGEYVAAVIAGIYDLEDAVTLVAARARLMQSLPAGGTMMAVTATEARVAELVAAYGDRVAIAAVNGARDVVISGDGAGVRTIAEALQAEGVTVRPLTVSHAFHSPLIDPILGDLTRVAARLTPREPRIRIATNVSGLFATPETPLDAAYWSRQARSAVRFHDAIRTVHTAGITTFLEIGPAPILGALTKQALKDASLRVYTSLRKGRDDWQTILDAVGGLSVAGVPFDWRAFEAPYARRRVALPTYPFQRQRFPLDVPLPTPVSSAEAPGSIDANRPTLGRAVRTARGGETLFNIDLAMPLPIYVSDHVMFGAPVFPAAAYVAMMLDAARTARGLAHQPINAEIADLRLHEPLLLDEALSADRFRRIQVTLASTDGTDGTGGTRIDIHSTTVEEHQRDPAPWSLHATATLRSLPHGHEMVQRPMTAAAAPLTLEAARGRCTRPVDIEDLYRRLSDAGAQYGPSFRRVAAIWLGDREAVGRLDVDRVPAGALDTATDPAIFDAALQVVATLSLDQAADADEMFVPIAFTRVHVAEAATTGVAAWVCGRRQEREGATTQTGVLVHDVALYDEDGTCLAVIEGFTARRASREALMRARQSGLGVDDWLYEVAWRADSSASALPVQDPAAAAAKAASWLICADKDGLGDALAERLRDAGGRCVTARTGSSYAVQGDRVTLDPADRDQVSQAVRALSPSPSGDTTSGTRAGVVLLWPLDAAQANDSATTAPDFVAPEHALLQIVQGLLAMPVADRPSRLIVATRGAAPAGAAAAGAALASPGAIAQAAACGLARTSAAEHPELGCRVVDLDPDASVDRQVATLIAEMQMEATREDHVAYRGGARQVPRLVRAPRRARSALDVPAEPFTAAIPERGSLDGIGFAPLAPRAPVGDEVQIRVSASSLNFRDVLNALGMYPGDAGPLGSECVGEVVALGPGADADRLHPGDRVMAFTDRAFATYAYGRSLLVQPVPASLSDSDAATLPVTYLTALYALEQIARLKRGERVLIHAAAGGVGLAAVYVAKRAGAEIFATAGSPAKRAFVKALGAAHVLDSRTLDFATQIRELTHGEGIDVVLNSLTHEAIDRGLSTLRAGGRFVEIGKIDLRDPAQVAKAWPGVTYTILDLATEFERDPVLARAQFEALAAAAADGSLPPLPRRRFRLRDVRDAFRFMAQAKQIGKVVVSHEPPAGTFRAAATYLVTGGLGGVGLTIGRWLAERGAGHVLLMGRSAPSATAETEIAEMEAAGSTVTVVRGDVSSRADVDTMLAGIPQDRPLRGIIHAAGVLDDGVVAQMDGERLARVMAPKGDAAWHLHAATRALDLDLFVLCSGGAALFASPGQGNYVAANAALDALAYYRRALGLPAASINWGPWSDVGMAARVDAREHARWKSQGLGTIPPRRGLHALEEVLRRDRVQLAVLPMEWGAFARHVGADRLPPFLAEVAREAGRERPAAQAGARPADTARVGTMRAGAMRARLDAAAPWDRRELLRSHVRDELRAVLALDSAYEIKGDRGLSELGMDSLMAVELSSRLQASLGHPLPATLAFERPSVDELTTHLLESVLKLPETAAAAQGSAADTSEAQALERLAGLSDEEVAEKLNSELDLAGY